MKVDLKSMTRKELEKLKADVEKALSKTNERELKMARDAAEKAAAAHGFSLAELAGAAPVKKTRAAKSTKAAKAPKTKSPPKFKNPDDANQTWTGKGRQPDWFKAAMASGKSQASMAV